MRFNLLLLPVLFSVSAELVADEVFSGPQVGERLAPFQARGVLGEADGEQFDFVTRADGNPLVLVFVHKITRPALGLTRIIMEYAADRSATKLTSGLVFLSEDPTDTENWMRRAAHALPKQVPAVVSLDGAEGPGAYGLNRNVTLTILVGSEGKVTANFALVQPSMQADALKIIKAISDVSGGGEVPTLADLGVGRRGARNQMRAGDPQLPGMLRALIQKDASREDVEAAASKVEKYVSKNSKARSEVGEKASRIVRSGRLKNYGTPFAQTFLSKWAKDWGPKDASRPAP